LCNLSNGVVRIGVEEIIVIDPKKSNPQPERSMDLKALSDHLDSIKKIIQDMAPTPPSLVQVEDEPKKLSEERSHKIGVCITQEERKRFEKIVHEYRKKFKRASTYHLLYRVILRYFLDNWQELPMDKSWQEELDLLKARSYTGRAIGEKPRV
jgi:hypothetical protein